MANKKTPGRKKKPGPKKASVMTLKAEIKTLKEQVGNLQAELDIYNVPHGVPSEPAVGQEVAPTEEILESVFTNEGFGVRIDDDGKYVLDSIRYNPSHTNVSTKLLCKGVHFAHAELELKRMLARGKIIPIKER